MSLRLSLGFRSLTLSDAVRPRHAYSTTTTIPVVGVAATTTTMTTTFVDSPRILRNHPMPSSFLPPLSSRLILHPLSRSFHAAATPPSSSSLPPLSSRLFLLLPFSRSFHGPGTTSRLDFRLAPLLYSEPLRKKRKIDPAVLKRRDEKIRGKIQRALDRLSRYADKLKPVDEFQVPRPLAKEREARTRRGFSEEPASSFEESERRARLKREFNEFSAVQHRRDVAAIRRARESQTRALADLKRESEELYSKALETDQRMLWLTSPMLTATPPIAGYEAPDGERKDVTKTFEYDVDFMSVLEANLTRSKPKWQLKKEAKEAAIAAEDDDDDVKKQKKKKKEEISRFAIVVPPPLNRR